MHEPSTLAGTVAGLRLLERSLDHSLTDRWERAQAYLSNAELSRHLAYILDSWAGVCEGLNSNRQRFVGFRRVFSRWASGAGQVELIPLDIARQALESFQIAVQLGKSLERPPNEEVIRVRMALAQSQRDLCRFSGTRGLSGWTDRVEHFNKAFHLKAVPLSAFMKRD